MCATSDARRRHCAARARGSLRVTACVRHCTHSAYTKVGSCSPLRRHDRSDARASHTMARGSHRAQRLHGASAALARADLGASEPHDSSAHGGLRCPTASQTRASHARRPCLRARPVPEVGRFLPFLRFFGFLHFSGFCSFCSFLRFFGFRAISRALDAISRETWQIRHQKAPNCLIGYPNLSLSFSLL